MPRSPSLSLAHTSTGARGVNAQRAVRLGTSHALVVRLRHGVPVVHDAGAPHGGPVVGPGGIGRRESGLAGGGRKKGCRPFRWAP